MFDTKTQVKSQPGAQAEISVLPGRAKLPDLTKMVEEQFRNVVKAQQEFRSQTQARRE